MMLYSGRESGTKTNSYVRGGSRLLTTYSSIAGFIRAPARLSEAEHNPLRKRASSATLNVQNTATEPGRDPDMRRNVPKAPLASPAAEIGVMPRWGCSRF